MGRKKSASPDQLLLPGFSSVVADHPGAGVPQSPQRPEGRRKARKIHDPQVRIYELLGSVFIHPRAMEVLANTIDTSHFESEPLAATYARLLRLHQQKRAITVDALIAEFKADGILLLDGGRGLHQLAAQCPKDFRLADLRKAARALRRSAQRQAA